MPVMFVGNKKDLLEDNETNEMQYPEMAKNNSVVFRQVQELSNANGFLRPLECSAKSGDNVKRIFNTVASELVRRKSSKPAVIHPNVVKTAKPCTCCIV